MLRARITAVTVTPKSGSPEVNSKIDPTAAIADTLDKAKNKPLFGVIPITLNQKPEKLTSIETGF